MSVTKVAKDNCQIEKNLNSQVMPRRDDIETCNDSQNRSLLNKGRSDRNYDIPSRHNANIKADREQSNHDHANHDDSDGALSGTCLYVSNLSHKVTDQQLMNIFSAYGKIDYANICYEPYSQQQRGQKIPRGIGFVKFVNSKHAQRAIEMLNGKMIKKKEIKIMISKREEPRSTQKGPYFGRSPERGGTTKKDGKRSKHNKTETKELGQNAFESEIEIEHHSSRQRSNSSSSSDSNGDLTFQQKIINSGKNHQRALDQEKQDTPPSGGSGGAKEEMNSYPNKEINGNNASSTQYLPFSNPYINFGNNMHQENSNNRQEEAKNTENKNGQNKKEEQSGNEEKEQTESQTAHPSKEPNQRRSRRRDNSKSRSRSDQDKKAQQSQLHNQRTQNQSKSSYSHKDNQHTNQRYKSNKRRSRYSSSSSSSSSSSQRSSSSSSDESNHSKESRQSRYSRQDSSSSRSHSPSQNSSSSSSLDSVQNNKNKSKDRHKKESNNNNNNKKKKQNGSRRNNHHKDSRRPESNSRKSSSQQQTKNN